MEVSIDGAEQVLLNITGGPDLSLFEAQDAAGIVQQAATSEVNLIFGTSINENLGDEVVVTVIATGIDNDGKTPKRPEAAQTTSQPVQPSTPKQTTNDDPFGNWDMRREPNPREQAKATEKFDEVEKKDFDIFKRTAQVDSDAVDTKQDNNDVPPFFKRRRK